MPRLRTLLVVLLLALHAARLFAQQPGAGQVAELPALPPELNERIPASRFEELAKTVAEQQRQLEALKAELRLRDSASVPAGDLLPANEHGPALLPASRTQVSPQEESIYPGSAAPAPPVPARQPYVIGSDRRLFGTWTNDGPIFESTNGDFTFHPRFVSQLDLIAVHNPASNIGVPGGAGTADSVDFRRLRLGCDGTMWHVIDYVFEVDVALILQNVDPANPPSQITGLRSGGTVGGVAQTQSGNTMSSILPTTVFVTYKDTPLLGNFGSATSRIG